MRGRNPRHPSLGLRTAACALGLLALVQPGASIAQHRPGVQPAPAPGGYNDYILGQQQRLEIVVHVLGEVQRPGEYRVPDNTNVLELLSKAGGGTTLADLSAVKVTHQGLEQPQLAQAGGGDAVLATDGNGTNSRADRRVVSVNIDAYLQGASDSPLPLLQPGDVVSVPKNNVATWKTGSAILRDLALVASTVFLYMRVSQ